MADPKQLRILKKLTALLEGINPENIDPETGEPYTHDFRGKIFRGVSVITSDRAEDALSILEMPRQEVFVPTGNGVVRNDDWQLMLQGWPADDPENPGDPAYVMKAKCEQRLARIIQEGNFNGGAYPEHYMLGPPPSGDGYELLSFTFTPGVVRPPEDATSRLAMFYMPLVLGVKMNVADPYL